MNPPRSKVPLMISAALLLLVLSVVLGILLASLKLREKTHGKPLPVYGQLADFILTNQTGRAVSLGDLSGHPWIADIIFTRCPGPCKRMTKQMKELQDVLPASDSIRFVSLTTDPDFDSPPVLKDYAEKYGADGNRWMFLTGTKKQIGDLASGGLKIAAVEKKPEERESPEDLFIHSTMFVIVDKRGQLRANFETTGETVDWQKKKTEIIAAVQQLEREK